MTSFVIPAQLIDMQRQKGDTTNAYNLSVVAEKSEQVETVPVAETTPTAQVAGVSTSKSAVRIVQIPGTSIRISIDSEIGLLLVIGMMLIAVALGLSVYLLATAGLPHLKH
jgi:hypothetical protein